MSPTGPLVSQSTWENPPVCMRADLIHLVMHCRAICVQQPSAFPARDGRSWQGAVTDPCRCRRCHPGEEVGGYERVDARARAGSVVGGERAVGFFGERNPS